MILTFPRTAIISPLTLSLLQVQRAYLKVAGIGFAGRWEGAELFKVFCEELSELVPRNEVLGLTLARQLRISAVVEVAMRGAGDDEQLLVLGIGIGLAYHVVSLSLAFHHILIGSLTEVARMGFLAVHHEDGRAYLVDVV